MTIETRPSAAHRWTKCSAAPLFASRAALASYRAALERAFAEGDAPAQAAARALQAPFEPP